LAALKAQKAHTYLAGNEVFQKPRTLQRWAGDGPIRKMLWAHAVRKAGVRYRRPYQTRHTYASMMLSAGKHPMWVAQQMGHSDWTMIARVSMGSGFRKRIRRLGRRLSALSGPVGKVKYP
jgi:integrase